MLAALLLDGLVQLRLGHETVSTVTRLTTPELEFLVDGLQRLAHRRVLDRPEGRQRDLLTSHERTPQER